MKQKNHEKSSLSYTEDSISKARQEGRESVEWLSTHTALLEDLRWITSTYNGQLPTGIIQLQDIQHHLLVTNHGRQTWQTNLVDFHIDTHTN